MRESDAGQRQLAITSTNDGLNGVLVVVQDFGRGLSADDLAHLFNAFYSSKPEGVGMRLTISGSIVVTADACGQRRTSGMVRHSICGCR